MSRARKFWPEAGSCVPSLKRPACITDACPTTAETGTGSSEHSETCLSPASGAGGRARPLPFIIRRSVFGVLSSEALRR